MQSTRVLILTVPHGASHERLATALRQALLQICPVLSVEVVDALEHCAFWFRIYYNSYQLPLKYWPGLWSLIEKIQHGATSTGPSWLYRQGGRPFFRFLERYSAGTVVATEVGLCELAAMFKRESRSEFCLVGAPTGVDIDRAWAQPEVNLYAVAGSDVAAKLTRAGVPSAKILLSGMPIDPAFASTVSRDAVRELLAIEPDIPMLLVLFGGAGFGSPERIVQEIRKIRQRLQVVFITGRNVHLRKHIARLTETDLRYRVLGWVNNMHEWMAAADLLLSKPGATTVIEALASGLPFVAFAPLPGGERRTCDWIEDSQVGVWVRRPADLAPTLEQLLISRDELRLLRERALALAHPRAAYEVADAILKAAGRLAATNGSAPLQTKTRSG